VYSAAIDVWSVGCIFMELMNHGSPVSGEDYMDQLRLITQVSIGTPVLPPSPEACRRDNLQLEVKNREFPFPGEGLRGPAQAHHAGQYRDSCPASLP